MKTRKIAAILLTIAAVFSMTACDGGESRPPRLPKDTGELVSFSYYFGSYHGGTWWYGVWEKDGKLYFGAEGGNGVHLDKIGEVDESVLRDIEQIIEEHNIKKWHGFHKFDKNVDDGFDFTVRANFENGTLEARGYMRYPKGFDEAHAALKAYLEKQADNTPWREPDLEGLEIGKNVELDRHLFTVLDIQDGKALVITERIRFTRAYHRPYKSYDTEGITWENSEIREWLNGEIYNDFNEAVRARIIETKVINSDNPEYGTDGGNDTNDFLFLLSIDEANQYFADSSARKSRYVNESDWWLRSPGYDGSVAAYINSNGEVKVGGANVDNSRDLGVRYAMWITLE